MRRRKCKFLTKNIDFFNFWLLVRSILILFKDNRTSRRRYKLFNFWDNRTEECIQIFISDIPVILAWVVNSNLFDLAALALKGIGKTNSYALKKENEEYAYYHLLPQNYNIQSKCAEIVTKTIKS